MASLILLNVMLIWICIAFAHAEATKIIYNNMYLPSYSRCPKVDNIAFGCLQKIYVNVTKCNENNGLYAYNSGDKSELCNWLWSNIVCNKLIAQVDLKLFLFYCPKYFANIFYKYYNVYLSCL